MDAKRLDFGDYVLIEQKRHGVPNEFYRYKVIRQFESSVYTDVPVQMSVERTVSRAIVPVVACICCGVDETRVLNFRVDDVRYDGGRQAVIDRLTLENWQLKGALGYPVPGNIIEGDWINGIADAKNAEIDLLNRAYEAAVVGLKEVSLLYPSIMSVVAYVQRIKDGKDGEQP